MLRVYKVAIDIKDDEHFELTVSRNDDVLKEASLHSLEAVTNEAAYAMRADVEGITVTAPLVNEKDLTKTVLIQFKKIWGNLAGPQIFGPGQKVWVSQWVADQLCSPNGYAEVVGRR